MLNERVKFRLLEMPCCGGLICWVNPRLPNYCPECGEGIFNRLKAQPELTKFQDDNAWLKLPGGKLSVTRG